VDNRAFLAKVGIEGKANPSSLLKSAMANATNKSPDFALLCCQTAVMTLIDMCHALRHHAAGRGLLEVERRR
jgi:hypothetical protein